MGCAASVSHGLDDDLGSVSPSAKLASKSFVTKKDDLEEFVKACLVTGSLVGSVKRFLANQSSSEAFLAFLKSEQSEENGQFFKVFLYYSYSLLTHIHCILSVGNGKS